MVAKTERNLTKIKLSPRLERKRAYLQDSDKNLKGFVILTLEFHVENNRWVATCVELGTSTFARNLSFAKARINEAVMCHLNCLEEVGERQRFFKENHIILHSTEPEKVVKVDTTANTERFYQSLVLPIPLGTAA